MKTQRFEDEQFRQFSLGTEQQDGSDDRKAASMEIEQEQHPHSHLFTLRVWEETLGGGKVEWRGRVQQVASGETLFFRDWPGLVAALRRLIANPPAAREGDTAQMLQTGNDHE